MSKVYVPDGYRSRLTVYETQSAIGLLKRTFEDHLSQALSLKRVSAPLFVEPHTGLNDDLNGVERPVEFDIKETGTNAQIVHSLAKWKRLALKQYGFPVGEGLYTDMNAVRRDEEMDNLHSIYVDQWDWEKRIDRATRTLQTLKDTVCSIVGAVCDTQDRLGRGLSRPDAHAVPRDQFCDDTGTGRPVPGPCPEGAGKRVSEGTQNRVHHADRRPAQIGRQARPGGPPIMTIGRSTEISYSGTMCWDARSRCRRWGSASMRHPWMSS